MPSSKRWIVPALLGVAVVASIVALVPVSTAGCTGTMYIYYETSAHINETGAKLVCPSGTYYDYGPDGYQETPYFVTVTMNCPCSGGNNGESNPNEEEAPD